MPGEDGLRQAQAWLQVQVPDPAALQAQEAADQAADHLSVGNAVTALRRIGAADWQDIVSRSSRVIREMLASPVFAAEDDTTRNATLHAIERLSVQSGHSGAHVARELIRAMAETPPRPAWPRTGCREMAARNWGARSACASTAGAGGGPYCGYHARPAYLGTLALRQRRGWWPRCCPFRWEPPPARPRWPSPHSRVF